MVSIKLLLIAVLLIIGCVAITRAEDQGFNGASLSRSVEDAAELQYAREVETDEDIMEAHRQRRGADACAPPSGSSSSSSSGSSNTAAPSSHPSSAPTTKPTTAPTTRPTTAPTTRPTTAPTTRPTTAPTTRPTTAPTTKPTSKPTTAPTTKPTTKPTSAPTTKPSSSSGSSSSSSGSSGSTVGLCDATTEPTKLLVPLYVYPGSAWDTVATGASKVGTIAIINPNSGPDSSGPDSSYTTYMNKLKSAGVEMVGYVYTSYGSRAISDVQKDIDTYASKYSGIVGIFFDEASDSASEISFYTQAYNYVMSKGMKYSILNPGVQPDQGYTSISTSIVVFEDEGSKVASLSFSSWVTCAPTAAQKTGYKYKFAGIAHSTASGSASSVLTNFKNKGLGLVYVTDGAAGCCTYNALVSYYASESTSVQSLNA